MRRHGDLRLQPVVQLGELGAARMAGDMDEMGAVGDDLDALLGQRVDDLADRLLVAGNGARGEDDAVARGEARAGRARRARCAPARRAARPGCRWRARESCRAAGGRADRGRAAPARRRNSRIRAPPRRRAPSRGRATTTCRPAAKPASAAARSRATLEAKVVTKTRPLRSARPVRRASSATSASDGLTPSRSTLVELQIERQHALFADFAQAALVGRRADRRRRVDLPVAGVDDDAGRGADRQRAALGNRMGDGNELDVERADVEPRAAERDDLDRDLRRARLGRGGAPRRARRRSASYRPARRAAATARPARRCDPRGRA